MPADAPPAGGPMSRRVRIRAKRSAFRRALRAALIVMSAGVVVGTFLVMRGLPRPLDPRIREPLTATAAPPPVEEPTPTPAPPRPKREVTLFTLEPQSGLLAPEVREVDQESSVAPQARRALEALFAPPADATALRLFPEGTRLLALFVDPKGEAFVDLSAEATRPTGVEEELLALASLGLTLSRNFPEIERLHILVEGRETTTFRGHVSVEYPLVAKDPAFEALVVGAATGEGLPLPAPAPEPPAAGPEGDAGARESGVRESDAREGAGPPAD